MTRKRNREEIENSEVDMTPMLDIVFILLIFFIVTTSFVKEEGLLINRPKASKNPASNNPIVLVRIDSNGQLSFNNKRVDVERLSARIESFLSANQATSAVIIPDKDATYDHVVKVIDEIKPFSQLTISIGK